MQHRRAFLKTAATFTSGLALTGIAGNLTACKAIASGSQGGSLHDFGLQLYTLREVLPKDVKGVLKQVASFGYKQIEGFEGPMGLFWGMKNTEFKSYLDSIGLVMVSSHCNINQDFERKADEATAIGMRYLIEPHYGPQKDVDGFKKAAELFNQRGEVCKKAGLRFAYHNHDYSFIPIDGQLGQDVMMQNTDPALVDFEMDIYWVVTGGQDPIAWFNKYPDRFRLCHVKDRKKGLPLTDKNAFSVLGKGMIDFPKILKAGQQKGLRYYINEQDQTYDTPALTAVKENADYLKRLKI